MACFPENQSAPGFVRRLACALAAAFAVCLLATAPAFGASSLADREVDPVEIRGVSAKAFGFASADVVEEGAAELAVPRFCPAMLSAECDPASIEAGVDCGMEWMCGIEPCLCGSSDAWGGCSCSGLEAVAPTVSYASSDEGVVRVADAFGRAWLVPVGVGTATVTCEASLKYFDGTTTQVSVTVGGPLLADGALLAAGVLAVALLAAAALAVRHLLRRRRGEGR